MGVCASVTPFVLISVGHYPVGHFAAILAWTPDQVHPKTPSSDQADVLEKGSSL